MTNGLLSLGVLVAELVFVAIAFRLGRYYLATTIATNLILISSFGAKVISILGFTTNAGNIFYASVFIATHLLVEHHGKEWGYRMVWLGSGTIAFFIVMSQLSILLVGEPSSGAVNDAIAIAFRASPRVALASLMAYIFSQYFNVWLYDWLRQKAGGKLLWLRSGGAHLGGQLLDSVLFFSIAFFELLPLPVLISAILVGFSIKVIVGFSGIPLIYASYHIKEQRG
jgi:uncharacterized integral membrane protein (TIGR00697 family)